MKNIAKNILLPSLVLLSMACRKQDEWVSPYKSSGNTALLKKSTPADAAIATTWYNLALKLVAETPGHTPPVAARSFGYMGVTLYESLVAEIKQHHSLAGQLNGFTHVPLRKYGDSYHSAIVANAALAAITKALFGNASAANMVGIDALESENEAAYHGHVSDVIVERSKEYGRQVAEAVSNWSRSDGGYEAYLHIYPTDFVPQVGVDKWIPTPPFFRPAMLPYWGRNRPMLPADNAGNIDLPEPPPFSIIKGSAFRNAAEEVYHTSQNLSSEEKLIAGYWSDDAFGTFTPPGHLIAIALQMIRNHNLDLNEAAILLAKMGIAQNDAGVVCWRMKYDLNLLRPITYINRYIDPGWATLLVTPPFPTYTSGHSTFAGAAASILNASIGPHISFTDSSVMAAGFAPRSFSDFDEAANESAMSRLYGGVHYRFDNDLGLMCGRNVAKNVGQLEW